VRMIALRKKVYASASAIGNSCKEEIKKKWNVVEMDYFITLNMYTKRNSPEANIITWRTRRLTKILLSYAKHNCYNFKQILHFF